MVVDKHKVAENYSSAEIHMVAGMDMVFAHQQVFALSLVSMQVFALSLVSDQSQVLLQDKVAGMNKVVEIHKVAGMNMEIEKLY